jgi:translation initiation factor 1 (eIF-1/SUI1)
LIDKVTEHAVNVRERSVHFKERLVHFREHSVHFMEGTVTVTVRMRGKSVCVAEGFPPSFTQIDRYSLAICLAKRVNALLDVGEGNIPLAFGRAC